MHHSCRLLYNGFMNASGLTTFLANLSSVWPGSVDYLYASWAGGCLKGLFFLGLLAFFVEVFVRSSRPVSANPFSRSRWCAIATLLCAPGALYAFSFCVFACCAHARYGGWPPTWRFYKEMEPWTGVFERWEPLLFLFAVITGVLAIVSSIPVFARWRRDAWLTAFRIFSLLSASSFFGVFLPILILPEGAIDWWFD